LRRPQPADALDVAPQVPRARGMRRRAARLGPARDDRGNDHCHTTAGWNVPIYTRRPNPSCASSWPTPTWIDGLTFAGGRLTAEVGTGAVRTFEQKLGAPRAFRPS
jgi:hypothetical protein